MDPQKTNPQDNRQEEEPKKEVIQIPNVFGRRTARLGGRLASRTGSMAGRLASRAAAQVGMMAGRALVQAGVALTANPIGLIVIGVIIAIVITVFIIIMFAGPDGMPPSDGSLTPTPNPISACPLGTTEKTVTASVDSFLAITETTNYYVNPYRCPPAGPFYSFSSLKSATINHTRTTVNSSCARMQWIDTTTEAVVNFSGFNIPKNSEIKSSTISLPSSGTCQASSISGRAETVDARNFSLPAFTSIGNFAGNIQCVACNSIDPTCRGRCVFSYYCGGYYLPQLTCANTSGSADISSFLSSMISSQDISALSFLVAPQKTDTYCDSPYSAYTVATGNFAISSPAALTIDYCSPN